MKMTLLIALIFISGSSFAGTKDNAFLCLEGLKGDSRFSSIANHVELDGQGAGSKLNDKTRPDDRQKQVITEWVDARSQCVNLSPNPVTINLHIAFMSLVADLYNGQLTFGEFNKKWQALFKEITKTHGN